MSQEILDQITIAIGSHRQWKQHLNSAIQSGSHHATPDDVRVDNRCEFGRWLHGLPSAVKATAEWHEVQHAHAAFHVEAAGVLDLALHGRKQEADAKMAFSGSFATASAQLTQAMMRWKTKVQPAHA